MNTLSSVSNQSGAKQIRQKCRDLLVQAARTFTGLLSMTFQAVAWNSESLYDEDSFHKAYERVREFTDSFADVRTERIRQLLVDYPQAVLVFRCIAALSLDELSALLGEIHDITLSKDLMRQCELGRELGNADRQRWTAASESLGRVLLDAVSGQLLELPASVDKSLFRDRKAKIDTHEGWKSVSRISAEGVPYWALLYQRYVGGFFRQAMDASSSIKGDILEVALVKLLEANRIPYYRTKSRERLASWEQAPDFLLPSRDAPIAAIEAKIAEDGGTARDKAARVERFCMEARKKKVFPIVVIDGKGFYRINDVTAPILKNTRGETYTLRTLGRILDISQVTALKGNRKE
ncbi:MAG: hypothetical protein HY237_10045 [Acidobacteria bacterium]|nr:hypothetical protein [Acidobacteriota bacterium]